MATECVKKLQGIVQHSVSAFRNHFAKVISLKGLIMYDQKSIINAEKMIYDAGLQSGKDAAVDELMGQTISALKKYQNAYNLFELLSGEPTASEKDRAILHHYMSAFLLRIDLLQNYNKTRS